MEHKVRIYPYPYPYPAFPLTHPSSLKPKLHDKSITNTLSRNPSLVKNAYTEDCIWRNRDEFFVGHEAIVAFLTKKWQKENGYRLRKELFAFSDDKVGWDWTFHNTMGIVTIGVWRVGNDLSFWLCDR